MLKELVREWNVIRQEKKRRVADLIRKAISNFIHVDLLVHSPEAELAAQEYIEQPWLGGNRFIKIVFITVKRIPPGRLDETHLNIPFEADCL